LVYRQLRSLAKVQSGIGINRQTIALERCQTRLGKKAAQYSSDM